MGIAFRIFLTIFLLVFSSSAIVTFLFGVLSLLTGSPIFEKIMGYAWAVLVICVVLTAIIIAVIITCVALHSIWTG